MGDFAFACTSRNVNQFLASFTTVYGYEFDDPNASDLGASHGAEIVYLMNTPGSNATRGANGTGDSLTLSRTMRRYWAQFARTGNPNATGVPSWTPFTTVTDNVQYLVPPTPRQDTGLVGRHKCALWGKSRQAASIRPIARKSTQPIADVVRTSAQGRRDRDVRRRRT